MKANNVKKRGTLQKGRRVHSAIAWDDDLDLNPDTNFTSLHAQAQRARMGLRIAATLLVIAGVLAAVHVTIQSLVYRNPQFQLRTVQFLTDGRLSDEELRREAGLSGNIELSQVDLAKVRDNLLRLPKIESVRTERVLPDKLKVIIQERKPIAWIQCPALGLKAFSPDSGYLIDAQGVPMKCEALFRDYLSLPVIEAPEIRGFSERVPITTPAVLSSLELLHKSARKFYEEQFEIKGVKILNDWSMMAVYGNSTRIVFSLNDLDRQLSSLHTLISAALKNGWLIAEANVIPRENIPVRFASANASSALTTIESGDMPPEPDAEAEPSTKPSRTNRQASRTVAEAPAPPTRPPSPAPPEATAAPQPEPASGRTVDKDVRAILGGLYQSP